MGDDLTEKMLENLDRERRMDDEGAMLVSIANLIACGVYPAETVPDNPNDILGMVKGWGARWYTWSGRLHCVHCNEDLRDYRTGPPFMRWIGMVENDRVTKMECPACQKDIRR